MPLLFSLGTHNALEDTQQQLEPGERLFAHLDDVYILSSPEWTRVLYNLLGTTLRDRASIQLHTGQDTYVELRRRAPVDMEDLGADVWNPEGINILGTPVGHLEFVSTFVEQRLFQEHKLWDAIPSVPGLAVRSAGAPPVRWAALPPFGADSAPPSQSLRYAQGHDARMQRAMEALLGSIPRDDAQVERARRITTLPLRMGGLGLRSGQRMKPGAFWASWADALPMLQQRLPELTRQVTNHVSEGPAFGCL